MSKFLDTSRRLADRPLDGDELQLLIARVSQELACLAPPDSWRRFWTRKDSVDILTHFTPDTPKVDSSGSRVERPVDGYSFALKLPAGGIGLNDVCGLAAWFENRLIGSKLSRDEDEWRTAQSRVTVGSGELRFGPYTAAQVRDL